MINGKISGEYGDYRYYREQEGVLHTGVDISAGDVETPVYSPCDGVVVKSSPIISGRPWNLIIKSTSDIVPGKTVYHIFYHLSPYVNNPSVGTVVRKGQKISRYATREEIIRDDRVRKLGKGSMPPHVHWEIVGIPDDIVRKESEPWSVKTGNPKYYYDPLVYLKTGKLVNRRAQREGYPIKLEPKLS